KEAHRGARARSVICNETSRTMELTYTKAYVDQRDTKGSFAQSTSEGIALRFCGLLNNFPNFRRENREENSDKKNHENIDEMCLCSHRPVTLATSATQQ